MENVQDILSTTELEHIVACLTATPLEWVGNEAWCKQMSFIEQLNVQAALEASRGSEERVRDELCETSKIQLLVHELLLLEMWKIEIMPRILDKGTGFKRHTGASVGDWFYSASFKVSLLAG